MTEYNVGDVLVEVSSYNMTFVYFYKVVSMTKTGKTLTYRKLNSVETADSHGFCGTKVPTDEFSTEETVTRRAKSAPKKWDGTPKYFNYLD